MPNASDTANESVTFRQPGPDGGHLGGAMLARAGEVATRYRYAVLALLWVGIAINYLDRANLAIAAPVLQKEMGISPAVMGIVFAAFSWLYMCMQAPAGIVLDRFGVRRTFGWALLVWSCCTCLFGFAANAIQLMGLRALLGTAEAPCFPSAQRAVSNWFPQKERGGAVCTYVSGEYLGLAFLTPLLAWMVVGFGWKSIFFISGLVGIVYAGVWFRLYREPTEHPRVNQAELDVLHAGGATYREAVKSQPFEWSALGKLMTKRDLWGVYLTKFFFSSSHSFYFTWFPHYLVTAKHMSLVTAGLWSMLPFFVSMMGMLSSGFFSDWLSRRVTSHTFARKFPVVLGMLLCATILAANYVDNVGLVMAIMSVAFFGQGVAGSVDALCCDIAPADKFGTTIGLFQLFSTLGGAIAPMVIGFILQLTGSYNGAMIYITTVALLSVVSIVFIIRRVERVSL